MTRHRELLESDLLASRLAIFTDAERVIADPVVRNRGTIGGALCQADPAEDLSAVCAAVGATLVVRGLDGERVLTMQEFHRGPYETAVGEAEMLTEVRVPLQDGAGSAYEKVERRVGDWAVAASAVAVRIEGGSIAQAGIALTAVGSAVTSDRAQERRSPDRRRARRRSPPPQTWPPRTARRPRTSAGPRSTSAIWRASSRCARCAPPPPAHCERRTDAGRPDHQRRGAQRRRRAAHAARPLHPRRPRPDRHALGLRHVQLRRVRRADGRRAGEVVHGAGGERRRPRDHDRRGPRARRGARSRPRGLHGGARPAVRLLHAGHDAHRPRAAGPQSEPDGAGDPRGDQRPDLSLHGLPEHRQGGPVGRGAPGPRRPRGADAWRPPKNRPSPATAG